MAFLLNLVLLFLFVVFLIVCMTAWRIYRSFRNVADRVRGTGHRQNSGPRSSRSYKQATEEETIIDSRTPDQVEQKIFTASEGEYVDFEEVK